jgi:hypothetical protein
MSINIVAFLKAFVIGLIIVIGLICGAAYWFMVSLRADTLIFSLAILAAILVGWAVLRKRS